MALSAAVQDEGQLPLAGRICTSALTALSLLGLVQLNVMLVCAAAALKMLGAAGGTCTDKYAYSVDTVY